MPLMILIPFFVSDHPSALCGSIDYSIAMFDNSPLADIFTFYSDS